MKKLFTSFIIALISCTNSFAQLCFSSEIDFRTGVNSVAACTADFNDDGFPDIAVANKQGTVSILLGNGAGSFGAETEYTAGALPVSICAADFNNDSLIDLAAALAGPWTTNILTGDGTGAFSSGSFVGYTSPLAVTAVDFNGDGKTDLAIATQYRVRISLGDGAGNFSAPVDFGAGHPYYSITAAYINNDTALDLACAGGYMNCAWVFYGDGNGSFSAPQNVPADSNVIDVVCGDFNFDGSTDLVTADKSNDEISEFYGDGAGNFGAPVNFSVGDGPVAIAKANLDGNAFPDLVVVNQFACSVAVLQNNLGNFSQPQYFQLDSFPHDVVVADFNNDGLDDIAAVCNLTNLDSGSVNLLINCSSTEINETENKKTELVISPNPCFQDFSIKGLPFPNKIFEISIFNILGKKVFEKISVLPAEKFSVANFSPGIYLVKISTEENVYEQKIVVQ